MLHLPPFESFPHQQEYLVLSRLALPEAEYDEDYTRELWHLLLMHTEEKQKKDLAQWILPLSFLHRKLDFFDFVAESFPKTPIQMSLKMSILMEWQEEKDFQDILPSFARLLHFGVEKPSEYINFLMHFFENPCIPPLFFAKEVPLSAWSPEFCNLVGVFAPTRPEPDALKILTSCLSPRFLAENFETLDLEEIYRQYPKDEKYFFFCEIKKSGKWSAFFRDEEALYQRAFLTSELSGINRKHTSPQEEAPRESKKEEKEKEKEGEGEEEAGDTGRVRKM